MSVAQDSTGPRKVLSISDGTAFYVGIVIGAGIFKTPSIIAFMTGTNELFIGVCIAGGVATLIGALCYAELASTYPNAGGEYNFLARAYGNRIAVLFAWARCSVFQTGAIAAVAFVFGEYAQQLLSLGPHGTAIWAAISVIAFTAINVVGTLEGARAQKLLEVLTILALLTVIVVGFTVAGGPQVKPAPANASTGNMIGIAMVLVLLTYGGWNEVAYLSGEMRDVRRDMLRIVLIGTAIVTALYVAFAMALRLALGLEGIKESKAVGADLMRLAAGEKGVALLAVTVCLSSLSTINGSVFTGARTYFSLGRDLPMVARIGKWDERGSNPTNALIVQGVITLALVGFGAIAQDGFEAMVAYTAPAFWFFLLLVAISLFLFRAREPNTPRPFKVPLYPITPALFVLICAYLLYSSLSYIWSRPDFIGLGAVIGVVVMLIGIPLMFAVPKKTDAATTGG